MKSARTSVLHAAACAAALALVAQAASAQKCNGGTPFSAGNMQVGVGFMSGGGTTLGANLNYGGKAPVFFGADVSRTTDDFDYSETGFGGHVGYVVQPASNPKVQICPGAIAMFYTATYGDFDGDESGNVIKIGASAGVTASESESMTVTPFGALSFVRYGWNFDNGVFEESASDTGFHLDLGAGFLFSEKYTIRPIVTIPVSFEGHDTGFGLWGSMSFGSAGSSARKAR